MKKKLTAIALSLILFFTQDALYVRAAETDIQPAGPEEVQDVPEDSQEEVPGAEDETEAEEEIQEELTEGDSFEEPEEPASEKETEETEKETEGTENKEGEGRAYEASAEDYDAWDLTNGVLTVKGNFPMEHFTAPEDLPWYEQKDQVKQLVLEDGISTLPEKVFSQYTGLTSADIAGTIKKLPVGAFMDCSALKTVTFREGLESIGRDCFIRSGITELNFPDSLKLIEGCAFMHCNGLSRLIIPDTLERLSGNVFNDCDSLKSIYISANVDGVTSFTFAKCKNLKTIIVDPANPYVTAVDSVLFNKDKTVLYTYAAQKSASRYEIPSTVKELGYSAFYKADNLLEIANTSKIEKLGPSAICNCSNLLSLDLRGLVSCEGCFAFDCSKLHTIIFSDAFTQRGDAFLHGCKALETLVFGTDAPIKTGTIIDFYNVNENLTIYAPEGAKGFESSSWGGRKIVRYTSGQKVLTLDHRNHYAPAPYTGNPIIPNIYQTMMGELEEGTDYTTEFRNNIEPGMAMIVFTGIGNYFGTVVFPFEIGKGTEGISYSYKPKMKVGQSAQIETREISRTPSFKSSNPTVASVTDTGLVKALSYGTTVITISVPENEHYVASSSECTITVVPDGTDLSSCSITLAKDTFVYGGEGYQECPSVSVNLNGSSLVQGTDYQVTYQNNTRPGTASVTVTGIGDYYGSAQANFTILKADQTLEASLSSGEMEAGDKAQIAVTGNKGSLTYASSDETVASVSADGMVEALSEGTVHITVTAGATEYYNSAKADLTVTVTEKEVTDGIEKISYSFANSRKAFGYPEDYRIPLTSYQVIYGKNTRAEAVYAARSGKNWGGNCAGLSASSALLTTAGSGLFPSAFKAGASCPKELSVGDASSALSLNLTSFIEAMHIVQYTEAFSRERKAHLILSTAIKAGNANLDGLYNAVKSKADSGIPTILALVQRGGHAILAYKVEEVSENESRIHVYDSNFPLQDRSVTMKKSGGHYNEWSYDMGSYGEWGTDSDESSISYISYETIRSIWDNRGKIGKNEANLAIVNSRSFAVYDVQGNLEAIVSNGKLSDNTGKISLIEDELSLTGSGSENVILSLPTETHTITNLDKTISRFAVNMVDTDLGVNIETTVQEVTLSVDDEYNVNALVMKAGAADSYDVTLSNSFAAGYDEVVVSGKGQGDILSISQSGTELNFSNCDVSLLMVDGERVGLYDIQASSTNGGTIEPAGTTSVRSGDTLTFTVTPDEGYEITDIFVDGDSVGAAGSYTFRKVDRGHTIMAVFRKKAAALSGTIKASLASDAAGKAVMTAPGGTRVLITASASGGSGGYSYKFLIYDNAAGAWYKLRDFTSANTYIWTPGATGTKTLFVDVKDSAGTTYRAKLSGFVVTEKQAALSGTVKASLVSDGTGKAVTTAPSGTKVLITAGGTGGSGGYSYKFLIYDNGAKTWYKFRDYTTTNTYTWTPGVTGTKTLFVDVKDSAGTTVRVKLSGFVVTEKQTALSGTVKASLASDGTGKAITRAKSGTRVLITAGGTGGSGSYTYKFLIYDNSAGTWFKLRDFTSASTYTWTPGATGTKTIFVDVKDSTGTIYRTKLSGFVVTEK